VAARQSADETAILYKQGLAKAIELFNANQSRFDAEISLAAAQLALRQGELDLRAALGLFPVEGVP
jgi:outer membrane protein TolC